MSNLEVPSSYSFHTSRASSLLLHLGRGGGSAFFAVPREIAFTHCTRAKSVRVCKQFLTPAGTKWRAKCRGVCLHGSTKEHILTCFIFTFTPLQHYTRLVFSAMWTKWKFKKRLHDFSFSFLGGGVYLHRWHFSAQANKKVSLSGVPGGLEYSLSLGQHTCAAASKSHV